MLLSCSIMKYSDILVDSNAVWIMRITVSFNRQGDRKLCWISYNEGITWSRNGIREILLVFSLNDSWNSTDEIMSWRRRTSGKVRISHSRMWHLSEICTALPLKYLMNIYYYPWCFLILLGMLIHVLPWKSLFRRIQYLNTYFGLWTIAYGIKQWTIESGLTVSCSNSNFAYT